VFDVTNVLLFVDSGLSTGLALILAVTVRGPVGDLGRFIEYDEADLRHTIPGVEHARVRSHVFYLENELALEARIAPSRTQMDGDSLPGERRSTGQQSEQIRGDRDVFVDVAQHKGASSELDGLVGISHQVLVVLGDVDL
jgi:hypothetical protein